MIGLLRWVLLFCGFGLLALDAHAVKPMVAAGFGYSIGLSADGKVYGWGSDAYGQLGLGRAVKVTVPQAIPNLNLGPGAGKSRVASGYAHSVTVKSDGSVWAWGDNQYGQLGDGTWTDRHSPVQVPGLTGMVAVKAGYNFSLALKSDGSVWAWGYNAHGELGDGSSVNRSSPVQVPGITGVVAVAAGDDHAIALKSDGSVWAWGYNGWGSLGDGTMTDRATPVRVPGLTGVAAVEAGGGHTLALKSDGSVWAWGYNSTGQLGDGTSADRSSPVQVPGLAGVVGLAAGGRNTLALKSDGSAWAWGYNGRGQLGDGTTTNRLSPAQVPGLTGVVALATGAHSLALKSDGSVWAWGSNGYGQLGDGTTTQRLSPVRVPGLTGVASVVASGGYFSLALKSDGSVWAWGNNAYGQLGDDAKSEHTTPVPVPGLTGMVAVAAGNYHTLALKSDSSVWAWGSNDNGQLGNGTTTSRGSPVQVPGLTGVVALAAGSNQSFALKSDGSVWAWGWNHRGQLGDGTTTSRSSPVQVLGLTGVVAIAAGTMHTLALKSDGSVWAWGDNSYGRLGDGTKTNRSSPVQVLTGAVAVAAGDSTIALKSDGSVWTWGWDYMTFEAGDLTTTLISSPVQAPGLTGVVAVAAAGWNHFFAVKPDGSVWRIFNDESMTTSEVTKLPDLVAFAAGSLHALALKSDGSVWAWGYNDYGQLGDGTYNDSSPYVGVINDTFSGFLDLDLTVPNLPVPADKIPPFLFAASKSGDLNSFDLSARVRLAPVNLDGNTLAQANRFAAGCGSGGTCRIYVAAHAPARKETPVCAPASAYATESWWSPDAQRKWNGLAWPLTAFLSNVVYDQDQMVQVDILSNCNLTGQTGTEFYLGYGEDADEMLKAGRYRVILTVPDK